MTTSKPSLKRSAKAAAAVAGLLLGTQCLADDVEYRTGGEAFAKAWQAFYVEADHEPELDDPLIEAGRPMVAAICEAVSHSDMKRRRYAISALGYIGDPAALATLEVILRTEDELDYFRGDALRSIYKIDRELGSKYAVHFELASGFLRTVAMAIGKREPWLVEPSEE